MSDGRKALLGMSVMLLAASGVVFALTRVGADSTAPPADTDDTPTLEPTTPPTTAPPATYVVQPGDTLSGIALRFDATAEAIIEENDLDDPDALHEGQTLLIPSPPPVWLEVDPTTTTVGRGVELTLTGAKPGESVTFEVHSPDGVYTGPPHVAPANGTVSTSYRPGIVDVVGIYRIVANGTQGTTAEAALLVEPAEP